MTVTQYSLLIKAPSFILLFVMVFINSNAFATITEVDDLSFGAIVVLDNTITSEITVDLQGRVTFTNHIRLIDLGHPAHFVLSNYTPYTQLFTSASVVTAETTSNNASSQQFTLINVTTSPTVTTSVAGIAEVFIGGTLQTSGSGTNQYYDQKYTAMILLTVNY